MIVIVNGVHTYHLEAEIEDDENIVIRVFEYGFAEGLRTMTALDDGERITLKFPNARIIYWETTKKTPDEVILALEFPDGGRYDYKVETLKFLEHEIEELEKRKLAILLPFYVLKLRKKVVAAKTSSARAKLAVEMKSLLDELMTAIGQAAETGLMNEADSRSVLEYTERLYSELYKEYDEFKEADAMLQDTILTYSEEAEQRGIEEGKKEGKEEVARNLIANGVSTDIIVKSTGLSLNKIQTLMQ
jgi:predicted transposase/invertase (TIGR01784 family)